MALTTKVVLKFNTVYTNPADFSTPKDVLIDDVSISLADGDGASQADVIFHDQRTLADGANEVLDLYASGSLLDPLGTALTIETLKLLYIYNNSSDASLKIFGGVTPIGICSDSSDIVILPPGGTFMWSAPDLTGLDITTNKNLKLEHDGTGTSTLTYNVIAIGVD